MFFELLKIFHAKKSSENMNLIFAGLTKLKKHEFNFL